MGKPSAVKLRCRPHADFDPDVKYVPDRNCLKGLLTLMKKILAETFCNIGSNIGMGTAPTR